jgi:hypothetical protein
MSEDGEEEDNSTLGSPDIEEGSDIDEGDDDRVA